MNFVEKGATKLMPNQGPPRILIVDDSQIDSCVTAEMLRGNYQTITAITGADAVQACNSGYLPKLILMDVSMTAMDGADTFKLLQSTPLSTNIPVILITLTTSMDEMCKAFDHGAVAY